MTLNITRIAEVDGGLEVVLELRNDSARPFEYPSDFPPHLKTDVQILTEGAWVDKFMFACFAPRILTLQPGKRVETTTYIFGERVKETTYLILENRLRHVLARVGVRRGEHGEVVVWSPVIDLATKKWGVRRD